MPEGPGVPTSVTARVYPSTRPPVYPSIVALIFALVGCGSGSPRLRYARIPEGVFWMGCVPQDKACNRDELPRHSASLARPVWMQLTVATVADWRRFVHATGYISEAERLHRGRMFDPTLRAWAWVDWLYWAAPLTVGERAPDDWPAVQVSWDDATRFCEWAGGRLPTEVEWERAARGGGDATIHVWGDQPTPRVDGEPRANGPDRGTRARFPTWNVFPDYDDGFPTLAPVRRFPPNRYGLYDMAGNVYQWTADPYDSTRYRRQAVSVLPVASAAESTYRVVRGGSWGYDPAHLRISFRGYFEGQGFWTATVGFRCVRDTPP